MASKQKRLIGAVLGFTMTLSAAVVGCNKDVREVQQMSMDKKKNEQERIAEKLDQHFFRVLDHAALPAEYADALRRNEKKTALRIAIKYFRNRPSSTFFADLKARKFDPETANRAARGEVTVVGITCKFPKGKINFLHDPTRATGVYNPEWQWQLNRMYFWNDMALSYLNQPDETLAAAFAEQLRDWVLYVPFPQRWNDRGSAWRTIETGLRLMDSWQTAFEVFRKSPAVTDETLALMLASMHEQTQHALEHRTGRNWLMMEVNGAYSFAMLFPEFNDSSEIAKESSYVLGEELRKQVLPDGMHNELSPDYQSVTYNCASMMYNIARQQNGTAALPDDFAKNLELLANAFLQLTAPGFTQPRTNDCSTIPLIANMQSAYKLFPHRKDFLWAASDRKEGSPPTGKTASRFLPYAGFVAMRSSWDKDASYLCFDIGPLGKAHAHQDKLNINIYKGDEELLFDDGGGQYEVSPFRVYAISGYDHNTVLIDGNAQHRNAPYEVSQAIDADFFSDERFDYACGIYDDTFGDEKIKSAIHKREVLFVKPDFFVVADTLTSRDSKAHDYTMLLQLDTLDVRTAGNSLRGVLSGEYDLFVLPLSENIKVRVESGRKNPFSGWYVGRNDKKLHPASTVKIIAEQQKDFRFLTLFFPLKKGAVPPRAERISESAWKIAFAGRTYTLDLVDLTGNFKQQ